MKERKESVSFIKNFFGFVSVVWLWSRDSQDVVFCIYFWFETVTTLEDSLIPKLSTGHNKRSSEAFFHEDLKQIYKFNLLIFPLNWSNIWCKVKTREIAAIKITIFY